MVKLKVYISQLVSLALMLSLWGAIALKLIETSGIDDQSTSASIEGLVSLIIIIVTIIGALLLGNLISYIFIARFFKIPRSDMEKVIRDHAKAEPVDGLAMARGFYKWCLDVAYKEKS